MALNEEISNQIIEFIQKEPRTVQEISKHIKKSWVTTDSYVNQIQDQKGLIQIKVFRAGTQGALKLVYYNYSDSLVTDEVKKYIYEQIKGGRKKQDFDFMDIYQYVKEDKKKIILEEFKDEMVSEIQDLKSLFTKAEKHIFVFSGNLSFINMKEKEIKIMDIIESKLKENVKLTILCRVNMASLSNIQKLSVLMQKYPNQIEIKHIYQPLRGFVIDDKIARFKNVENVNEYKSGELLTNIRIFYEIYETEWVEWLQKVFWNLFRSSINYKIRIKEMEHLF